TSFSPACVFIGGISELLCEPILHGDAGTQRSYGGTGVLALAGGQRKTGLVMAYLTAREARPDLGARFKYGDGGSSMSAHMRFLGRRLRPGESLELDRVYLSAQADPYTAIE